MLLAAATMVLCLAVGAAPAGAAPGDIGFEGPSFGSLESSLTGSKPESKLWFNDGRWWASMYDDGAGANRIFRLDRASHSWASTPTALDDRDTSRADVLWEGASGKLYVASHLFVTTGVATSLPGAAGRLYRYTYDPTTASYSLDVGYPATVNGAQTETLVIDKDSTGTLWATWTQGQRVYVNHTVGENDAAWGTPYIVPGGGTTLDNDDISSLIHFGSQIGVMWSNQADGKVYFSIHPDGAGDGAWSTEVVATGASPDDHINLKADSAGRVYAAVKTSDGSASRPLALLMQRGAGGGWSAHTFGTVSDSHTRPIVELEEQRGLLHMLATCPQPPSANGQSGGDICLKTTPMSNPSFASGIGTAVIRDASSNRMNDATSTKQGLDSLTGLIVLANNATTRVYWHADLGLGGVPPPPPVAGFQIDATAGPTPLDVRFADGSSGAPTSWWWSFGDGTGSSARSPTHRYASAGTYTVTLKVATASQSDVHSETFRVGGAAGISPPPSSGILGLRRPRLTLHAKRLGRQRVLLWGSVRPVASAPKVTLQRRDRRGRWLLLRSTRARLGRGETARFGFVVRRLRTRSAYRVVVTVAGSGRRSSRTVLVGKLPLRPQRAAR